MWVTCLVCEHLEGEEVREGNVALGLVSDGVWSAGIDSRSGHVYCFLCEDFIYDPTLEEIRMEREASVEGNRKSPPPYTYSAIECRRRGSNDSTMIQLASADAPTTTVPLPKTSNT